MFNIKMLQAGHGDCLWIEYGAVESPLRILVDGGTAGTYQILKKQIEKLPLPKRHFELMVVTHIDADHVAGVLKLLNDPPDGITFGDIWFNGWRHLPGSPLESLGPVQGELLTDQLNKPEIPWNKAFDSVGVVIEKQGPFPQITLRSGMKLTILSPGIEQLMELKPFWEEEIRKAGLDPSSPPREEEYQETRQSGLERLGTEALPDVNALAAAPYKEDDSRANGSSVAMLLEYNGHSVLLSGDAHAEVLISSLERLCAQRNLNLIPLDVSKLSHHGSKANISKELLEKIDCKRYLISTNGAYFKHPDEEAIARTIKYGGLSPHLYFNYLSTYNHVWSNQWLKNEYGYSTTYSKKESENLTIMLE